MPYTIAEWIRDNARVFVVLPGIDRQIAVPACVLAGEDGSAPKYYYARVQPGHEAEELQRQQQAEEGG